jgi:hypothetical protein
MDALSNLKDRSRLFRDQQALSTTQEKPTEASPAQAETTRKDADQKAAQAADAYYSAPMVDARGASRAMPSPNQSDDWSVAKKSYEFTKKYDKPLQEDKVGNALLGLPGQIITKGVQWLGIWLAEELADEAAKDTLKRVLPEVKPR